MSLSFKGVLEYIKNNNGEYCDKSKDVFFRILMNMWLFCVLIADLDSLGIDDLEYIGIS
jgi:hypothetical protein